MAPRPSASTAARLTAAAGDRDRVLDAVKAFALLVVVVAHSMAWDVGAGVPASVLDVRPDLAWLTWTAQVLPLFFAAGAVSNAASWDRRPEVRAFLRHRLLRLGTPALVYAGFWTPLLLALALVVPLAELAGRFLAQLLWFLGVYAAVVTAVPWTLRWARRRPLMTLALWLTAIALVDALRWNVAAPLGALNLLLVWGFCHQLGYQLPVLRRARALVLVPGALAAAGVAVALAVLGPYSSSMVSYAGDPEPSNLSPPTLVVALYGTCLVLLLAAVWPALSRLLRRDAVYLAVAVVGSRAVEVYLWHIPLVAGVAGVAWLVGVDAPALSAAWLGAHLAGLLVVLGLAWVVAGVAGRMERSLQARAAAWPRRVLPALPFAIVLSGAIIEMSATGFGTWWGPGQLGLPACAAVVLGGLAVAWWALAVGGEAAGPA